jgi:vacuolar-type H+-ATPase subunit I/STV1
MGSVCDEYYDYESRLCPENLIGELIKASFVSEQNQGKRPVLTGKEKELLTETYVPRKTILTPTLVFGFLLLFTCFLTYAEWRWQWIKPARCFDSMLLTIQSLIGIVLLYITFVSELLGSHFNWYLIPFNPLPLLLWICLRKRKNYGRVYLLYTVVLVAFIALTPFLSQLDVPHQMITMVLAVRCGSKCWKNKGLFENEYSQ